MNRLTAAKVRNLINPGRYSDGEGLYLNIARRGSKSVGFSAYPLTAFDAISALEDIRP